MYLHSAHVSTYVRMYSMNVGTYVRTYIRMYGMHAVYFNY